MSDNRHTEHNNAEHKGSISNEALEDLIGDIFMEDDIDVDLLEDLLEVYKKRVDLPNSDINAALERFKRDYIGNEEAYLTEDAEKTTQTIITHMSVQPQKRKRTLRYRYVVAAILMIFFFVTPAGASLRGVIAQWSSETFSFGSQGISKKISEELKSLHDALTEHGITDRIAPRWLPDGFTLLELTVIHIPDRTVLYSYYSNGEKTISIQIANLKDSSSYYYEKDESEITLYQRNGVDHYIMTNNGKAVVVWGIGSYECAISGDISVDEAKIMIDSIYER